MAARHKPPQLRTKIRSRSSWGARQQGQVHDGRRHVKTLMKRTEQMKRAEQMNAKYPGIPSVIHGNGAIAEVMGHVCGGVIGYPITPSTEISEIYEAFRAGGGMQRLGHAPFLLRAGRRAFRTVRRARRGTDGRQIHFQRLVEPGHPVRPGIALRDGRQAGRRLRAAMRGARRLQALAERHGRS